jgi:GNAT superfamily N-acetyltransferase
VREATARDADALGEVAAATFPLACPPETSSSAIAEFIETQLSPTRFEEYLGAEDRMILLAEDADTAVGYAMLVFAEPADADVAAAVTTRPTVELSKFYVLPHHHGGGIAAPLMAATLAAVRRGSGDSVWLGVNQQNARARRFYEKSGFAVVGTKTFLVGPELHHDYVLERLVS